MARARLRYDAAGTANETIVSDTDRPITPALDYYYSPHAERVFAHQPGQVSITWVTSRPLSEIGDQHGVKTEIFSVSSNTQRPIRTIFWTEGAFSGPKVEMTDSRISTVNPIFNARVPQAVAEEVRIPGFESTVENRSTLSFTKFNGVGQLSAYNVEGRILVEYLGDVRLADNIYEYVGYDVVEIKRVPTTHYVTAHLGAELRPPRRHRPVNCPTCRRRY